MLFERILAPLDGSNSAESVLPWVKKYAGPSQARVALLMVVDPRFRTDDNLDEAMSHAETYLEGVAADLRNQGLDAHVLVKPAAFAAARIAATAKRLKADLVMLSARGGSPVARWFIGGVAENVLRLAEVPVFLVPADAGPPDRISQILVPLDGSTVAEAGLPWIERLAHHHRAQLRFLHVIPERAGDVSAKHAEVLDALRSRMEYVRAGLRDRGLTSEFEIASGDPASIILDRTPVGHTVVAMTTRGFGGLKRWIFGSVAEKVIHGARVPVFIYKHAKAAAKPVDEFVKAEQFGE
jgi:nucleotide-binding universal stress UspA family protein